MTKTQNTRLPRPFRNKLIRALRSGKYSQGFGEMKAVGEESYDVLGVAYRIAGVNKGSIAKMIHPNGKHYNFLPKLLYSDSSPVVNKLINLNDGKQMPFKWIASYIEDHM